MNRPYWECLQCDWIGKWGQAKECVEENWEGETTFYAFCPKCNSPVKNIKENDYDEMD